MMLGIQLFLGVIGGLTLIVGGVGVANIMYAVVKERTREIGVKMALGARSSWVTGPIVLEGLVYISVADGFFHPGEDAFLAEVHAIFGLPEQTFRAIKARHMPDITDPYEILGVDPALDNAAIRRHWRNLVRELHPDGMIGRGVPIEAQRLAEQRLAAVNDAYETIKKERAAD